MPLLDHFRPPLNDEAPWTSIGSFWIVGIARFLNRTLPAEGFRAYPHVHLGRTGEADVAEYQSDTIALGSDPSIESRVAVARPPAVADEFEVQIFDLRAGRRLVAVIEIVSPANKDRPTERRQFVTKCSGYLRNGLGLVIVDVVTDRRFNLHNDLLDVMGRSVPGLADTWTYASAYLPRQVDSRRTIDAWPYPAVVGSPIPAVPLPLPGGPAVMLDLEATYQDALADSGL